VLSPAQKHTLQILQSLLAIIILAYGIDYLSSLDTIGFAILVSVISIIVLEYSFALLFRVLALYNRIAVLLLECLLHMWSLSTFAVLAAWIR
jgi:hypothetical protein